LFVSGLRCQCFQVSLPGMHRGRVDSISSFVILYKKENILI
jgi:hypothetical protein